MQAAQSRLSLCDPVDSTAHGILQARILEWVVIPFSRGFSQPRDGSQVSRIAGRFFTSRATLRQSRICLQCGRPRFHPWVGKLPWRREWQPTPVFLPGESHGQRSLVGYSHGAAKSQTQLSDKHLHFHFSRKWRGKPCSWVGNFNTVKTSTFPKLKTLGWNTIPERFFFFW